MRSFPGEGGDCPEKLEAGAKCVIALTFLPLATKDESVEMEVFYNNGLREDSRKLTLKGLEGKELL